jgi:CoA:oxalate CoA-transferase
MRPDYGGTEVSVLEGIRVLDLSRVMSGPYCTAMLADLGAQVIKLETPGSGDDSRHFGPFVNGASVYFALLNRGKKSVALNLKHPRGREMAQRLAAESDVVVENFRPGVTARLGLDYETLSAANARLVYLSISGFGQTGPFADRPAYDLIVQAMSGLMSITGQADGPPTAVGESMADVATGMFGAFAITSALYQRERSGRGTHIDLAMFDSLLAMQTTALSRLFAAGTAPGRVGNRHPVTVPVDTFRAMDGIFAMVVPSDAHFRRLCELIGRPEFAQDPRFESNAARASHEAELKAAIERWSGVLPLEQCVAACGRADIPAGPVWDLKQATASEHSIARAVLEPVAHPVFGQLGMVAQPARFSSQGRSPAMREPLLGEHTAEVLQGLGVNQQALDAMKRDGAI